MVEPLAATICLDQAVPDAVSLRYADIVMTPSGIGSSVVLSNHIIFPRCVPLIKM